MSKFIRKIGFFLINTVVITIITYLGLVFISNTWNTFSFDKTLKIMAFLIWSFAMAGNTACVLGEQK